MAGDSSSVFHVASVNMLNYAFGITRAALRDYILGSIGMIPATVMYVYLGSLAMDINLLNSASNISSQARTIQWVYSHDRITCYCTCQCMSFSNCDAIAPANY